MRDKADDRLEQYLDDQLQSLLARQSAFQVLVDHLLPEGRPARARELALRAGTEIADFLKSLDFDNTRQVPQRNRRSAQLEEWIDVFKYWLAVADALGFDHREIVIEFDRKSHLVSQRFNQEFVLKVDSERLAVVDLDGVLADYGSAYVDYLRSLGLNIPPDWQQDSYDLIGIGKRFGLSWKDSYKAKETFRETGRKLTLPVFYGAAEGCFTLRKCGFQILILTSRPYTEFKRVWVDSVLWLRNKGICYDAVHIADDKRKWIVENVGDAAVFFDDHPPNVDAVHSLGIPCYLIDAKYNKSAWTNETTIRRAKNFIEAVKDFTKEIKQ